MSWQDREFDAYNDYNLKRAMALLNRQPTEQLGINDVGAYGQASATAANAAAPTPPATTAAAATPSSTGSGGNTGMGDQFSALNPQASVRPLFEQLGLASRQGNPWVQYFSSRVAPGLTMLYEMQNPGASVHGFTDWMKNFMQQASAPGGNWNNFQQFGNAINQLLQQGAQAGSAMAGYFGADVDPQDQAQYLNRLLQTYGAMNMTPGTLRAIQADLADKLSQYAGASNMGQALPNSWLDWLRQGNFGETWRRVFGG